MEAGLAKYGSQKSLSGLAVNTVHMFGNTVHCSLFTTVVHTFAERPAAEPAAPDKKPAAERPARGDNNSRIPRITLICKVRAMPRIKPIVTFDHRNTKEEWFAAWKGAA